MRFDEYAAWRLAHLLDNTERGHVGEYLVATAVGDSRGGQRNWRPYDLDTPGGTAVEVKTAGLLQAWGDGTPRVPVFSVGRATRWWGHEQGRYLGEHRQRWSQVMVFALHNWTDRDTADPLNEHQWRFWVLPTAGITEEFGERGGRASRSRLEQLGAVSRRIDGLQDAVEQAARC